MSNKITQVMSNVRPVDERAAAETQELLNRKSKPPGSLGHLERLACKLAAISGSSPPPRLAKTIIVMGGDHGITEEGVSAYPSEVTAQMVANFVAGGAAINVLARQANATLFVVDMGGQQEAVASGVLDRRVAAGTQNFLRGPAMTVAQAEQAILSGINVAQALIDDGVNLIALGEMGIGNTTSAAALCSAILNLPAAQVTGRGTGIDDAKLIHKIEVVDQAVALHKQAMTTPLQTLACLGGFEIAGLVGVCLAAAASRVPILLDGFITSAAALVAVQMCPLVKGHLVASHISVERGHAAVFKELQLEPLFDLNLRLGEGSGAALAMPMLDAAVAIVHEMATFASAGVTES